MLIFQITFRLRRICETAEIACSSLKRKKDEFAIPMNQHGRWSAYVIFKFPLNLIVWNTMTHQKKTLNLHMTVNLF